MLFMAAITLVTLQGHAQEKAGKKDTAAHYKVYTCPMHNEVTAKEPGNCRICGMKLQLSKKEQMKAEATRHYACPMHPEEVSDKPGKCSKCGMTLNLSPKEKMKMGAMNNYTCPMHANVRSNKPGTCPNCGMKLTPAKTNKQD